VAGAVYVARASGSKAATRDFLEDTFGYGCSSSVEDLRAQSRFDVTCQGTVPAAAVAFLTANDFEDAIRNAISLGGDADTLACIAGALAEAFYGPVPLSIQQEAIFRLDAPLMRSGRSPGAIVFPWRPCLSLEMSDFGAGRMQHTALGPDCAKRLRRRPRSLLVLPLGAPPSGPCPP